MPLNQWEWKGGGLQTVVGSSESILFAGPGGGFSTSLLVGDTHGQEGTYVRNTALGTSGGELPNCRFINNSQAEVSGSTVNISTVAPAQCTLRVRLTTHLMGSVATTNSYFDAYGDTVIASPAAGNATLYAFEQSNSSWSIIDYPASSRLSLNAQATLGMTHDWYIGLSARVGAEGTFSDITFRVVTEYTS